MVHARVSDKYIHFELMYTTDHIFPVMPIKHLVNWDSKPTMPHKLETGTKPSVWNLRVLFCPCVVRKATAHLYTMSLDMLHYSKDGIRDIFVGIPQHKKRVPHLCTYYTENSLFIWRSIWQNCFYWVMIRFMSVLRGTGDAIRSLINSVHYIISWTNWLYNNFCTVWRG